MGSMSTDLVLKKTVSLARGRVTADANGTGVDVSKFEGRGVVVFDVEYVSGTATTYDVKLQHSEDDGSADPYTDLKGPDGNNVAPTQVGVAASLQQKPVDWSACKKYVRAVHDVSASGTPVYNPVILAEGYQQSGSA